MSDPIAHTAPTDAPAAAPASVEFKLRDDVQVDPADWAARAAAVRIGLAEDGLPASDMIPALNAFRFLDDAGATWAYSGSEWSSWNGTTWVTSAPPPALKLQPFTLELVPNVPDRGPDPDPVPTTASPQTAIDPGASPESAIATPVPPVEAVPVVANPAVVPQPNSATTQPLQPQQPSPTPATYRPSHVVPPTGVPAWSQPDPSKSPVAHLGPGLDVMVVEWLPTAWARIVCSNQWSGWVDGRYLVPIGR